MRSLALKFATLLERCLDDIDETDEVPGIARNVPATVLPPPPTRGKPMTVLPWPLAEPSKRRSRSARPKAQ